MVQEHRLLFELSGRIRPEPFIAYIEVTIETSHSEVVNTWKPDQTKFRHSSKSGPTGDQTLLVKQVEILQQLEMDRETIAATWAGRYVKIIRDCAPFVSSAPSQVMKAKVAQHESNNRSD